MQKTQSQIEACTSLIREHREMEILLQQLKQALTDLKPGLSIDGIRTLMAQIETEINIHFACEEKALFPAVSPYHPMVLMEAEHEELVALRDDILTRLGNPVSSANEQDPLREVGHQFINEMLDHMGREEAGIFPTCEKALSDDEKEAVIAGMEQIRQDALQAPIPPISRPERTFQAYQLDLTSELPRELHSKRIFEDASLEVKQITIQAGKSLTAHWTPKKALLICLQGEGVFSANEKEQPLTPGTLVSMSPQLRHAISAKTRCDILLLLESL